MVYIIVFLIYIIGFIVLIWSDYKLEKRINNLYNIWHSANKKPTKKEFTILCVDEFNNCWISDSHEIYNDFIDWEEFSSCLNIKYWAYIENLLPTKNLHYFKVYKIK